MNVVHILNEIFGPLVDSLLLRRDSSKEKNLTLILLTIKYSTRFRSTTKKFWRQEKTRSLVMTATPEQLQAVRTNVLKITNQLRVVERDSDLQKHLLDKMRSKFEIAEENPEEESTKLAKISSKLIDFDHGQECNKLYINAQK